MGSQGSAVRRDRELAWRYLSCRLYLSPAAQNRLQCARPEGRAPRSDGEAGVRVVRVLEELQRSLDGGA